VHYIPENPGYCALYQLYTIYFYNKSVNFIGYKSFYWWWLDIYYVLQIYKIFFKFPIIVYFDYKLLLFAIIQPN